MANHIKIISSFWLFISIWTALSYPFLVTWTFLAAFVVILRTGLVIFIFFQFIALIYCECPATLKILTLFDQSLPKLPLSLLLIYLWSFWSPLASFNPPISLSETIKPAFTCLQPRLQALLYFKPSTSVLTRDGWLWP